jgi:hypothetical protein
MNSVNAPGFGSGGVRVRVRACARARVCACLFVFALTSRSMLGTQLKNRLLRRERSSTGKALCVMPSVKITTSPGAAKTGSANSSLEASLRSR